MRTAGITGANGYVGSRLVQALETAGFCVIRLVREPRPATTDRKYSLDCEVPDGLLDGLDILVHCAWDMRVSDWQDVRRINIDGSRRLFDAAERAGTARVIFISSMSAFNGCKSNYGQAKLVAEAHARLNAAALIVRPGLIYGDTPGGIVGSMLAIARRIPILPMVGRGRYKLHACHEHDLAALVTACCDPSASPTPGSAPVFIAAEPLAREFRDIIRILAGRRLLFVPVPWRLVWFVLRVLESVGIRTRLKSDSLVGLVNSDPAPDFSNHAALPFVFRPLTQSHK